ncbi:MAG: hypothetical protein JWQ27_443 [Ferruginibacter sp.]|nr:hypothetical protein [Ferruginibacter sp.]
MKESFTLDTKIAVKKHKHANKEADERLFWKNGFGFNSLEDIPVKVEHMKLSGTDITAVELSYLAERIKTIGMLDLNHTNFGNEGIRALLKLESVRELRLKENEGIDNDCMEDIGQMPDLEFLHLRGTAVNVDGLTKITSLKKLSTVLVSDDREEEWIRKAMAPIVAALPDCSFSVNNIQFYPREPWEKILAEQQQGHSENL